MASTLEQRGGHVLVLDGDGQMAEIMVGGYGLDIWAEGGARLAVTSGSGSRRGPHVVVEVVPRLRHPCARRGSGHRLIQLLQVLPGGAYEP